MDQDVPVISVNLCGPHSTVTLNIMWSIGANAW